MSNARPALAQFHHLKKMCLQKLEAGCYNRHMSAPITPPSEISEPASRRDLVHSLRRGLEILELLAGVPEGLLAKNISARSGLNLSTCYHLLNTLIAAGYVAKHAGTQRFALTGKISYASHSAFDGARIVPALQAHLQSLRDTTRETAYLSLRHDREIVIGAIVDSPRTLRVALLCVGYDGANHAMALGKAILAYLDERDVAAYLSRRGMPPLTSNTITDQATFAAELAATRARGYSLDLEEFADDICCIAAPIFGAAGRVVGSIGIALPASRYASAGAELAPQVTSTAAAATRALAVLGHLEPAD
jgi:IclR family acetate operon transcriptional repressor